MGLGEIGCKTLEEYRASEIEFHRELMKVCRRYMNEIDIACMVGIIDIVKRETIDLESATRQNLMNEKSITENKENTDVNFFS
ncbi:MAG: hypothetical protein JSW62_00795 [Thermoplasmatales archaeon]|nr:MAG: hypothetical protein JSW62_00795 [Thermoplasmatales archaeon]